MGKVMREIESLSDIEFDFICVTAIEWRYLTVLSGKMAVKSKLDEFLMNRFDLSECCAHTISNHTESENDRNYFHIENRKVFWTGGKDSVPEPKWEDLSGDVSPKTESEKTENGNIDFINPWEKKPAMFVHKYSQPDRKDLSAMELAGDYKFRGYDRFVSWDNFVKDRGLCPEINAKEFYKIFDSVSPRDVTLHEVVEFNPTHWDDLLRCYVCITTDEMGVYSLLWENGMSGSNPPSFPPDVNRFKPFVG